MGTGGSRGGRNEAHGAKEDVEEKEERKKCERAPNVVDPEPSAPGRQATVIPPLDSINIIASTSPTSFLFPSLPISDIAVFPNLEALLLVSHNTGIVYLIEVNRLPLLVTPCPSSSILPRASLRPQLI